MLAAFVKGRTAVFVDASNIYYSQRTLSWLIDYVKLQRYFAEEVDLVSLRFYTSVDSRRGGQRKFIEKLSALGYHICAKEIKAIRIGEGQTIHKGNLDGELIVDALKYVDTYDTFVLMSGDSDFAPLLDELKSRGKRVIVMSSKHHVARELLERAKYVNLRRLAARLAYKKSPPAAKPGERADRANYN